MESELENPIPAILGLAILSAIPIVIFALWAEYFEKYVHQLLIKKRDLNYEPELEKIRLGSFLVILFDLSLFLGSTELRTEFPVTCFLIFGSALMTQLMVQTHLQNKITPIEKRTDSLVELGVRAIISWIVGVSVHIVILGIFVKTASEIAERVGMSSLPGLILTIMGGVLGLVTGLCVNFALSPYHFRKTLPSSVLEDQAVAKRLENCFEKAGIPSPSFWVVELKQLRVVNVVSVGFQTHMGPLRPAFFICRAVLNSLSTSELEAVVLNEISHIALNHTGKRFGLTSFLILVTAVLAIASILVGQHFFPKDLVMEILGPAVAFASFVVSLRFLTDQHKNHEYEGDIYSIEKLGVAKDVLKSALRKLAPPMAPDQLELGDFDTELRISAIEEHFKKPDIQKTDHSDSQDSDTQKAA